MLETVEINPKITPATHSIIWLHGLGADGHDFIDIIPKLNISKDLAIRFIFPHAPIRKVTFMRGEKMRAWFDIEELGKESIQDQQEIRKAQILLDELIAQEIANGIQSNRIILIGFSQGGATVIQSGLRYPKPLAGILVLSGWLPIANKVQDEKAVCNQNIPIQLMHGTEDSLVTPSLAMYSYKNLKTLGYNIDLKTYPMAHTICKEEISDIAAWIKKIYAQ
jgi:phospholipase/carboxylesterase